MGVILEEKKLEAWLQDFRQTKDKLVFTNGCFDILHAGHVDYLQNARQLGDALLVGLNNDESVRKLKGGTVKVLPFLEGHSTTSIIKKIKEQG